MTAPAPSSPLLRAEEKAPFFWASLCFFCLLMAYYMLRNLQSAISSTPLFLRQQAWLTTVAALLMLAINPLYGALATWLSRTKLVLYSYGLFGLMLLGFALVFCQSHVSTKQMYESLTGRSFWVWVNVFNMFVVSVFWDVMLDVFPERQDSRLFVGVGIFGSLGAIVGALSAARWSTWSARHPQVPPDALLLVSVFLLGVATYALYRLAASFSSRTRSADVYTPPGKHPLSGLSAIWSSQYLRRICLYMVLLGVGSGLLYLQLRQSISDRATQTSWAWVKSYYAYVDLAISGGGLLLQLFVAQRFTKRAGVGTTLALLPLVVLGAAALLYPFSQWNANQPQRLLWLLPLMTGFHVLVRMLEFSTVKPARKLLFTVVDRDKKYSAQSLIDTFVHRSSDVLVVWGLHGFQALSLASSAWVAARAPSFLLFVGIPLWLGWLYLSIWLGRQFQKRLA